MGTPLEMKASKIGNSQPETLHAFFSYFSLLNSLKLFLYTQHRVFYV